MTNIFSGDPLALTPFMKSISFLEGMDEDHVHENVLRDFILTKLQGMAAECLPENPTLMQIKTILKEKIKPESSKIIMGRMMAVRADRTNFTDYAKKAEELAEKLKRSLIMENIPVENANNMTIDQTIELCKTNTRSPVVKAALIATPFKDAKEVVAKLIVESRNESSDTQVLAYRTNRLNPSQQRGNFRKNVRGRGQTQNSRGFYQNNNFRNANGRNWQRNDSSRSFGQNNRGNNRNANWRSNNRPSNFNGNRRGRIYYTENETAPPSGANTNSNQRVHINQAE